MTHASLISRARGISLGLYAADLGALRSAAETSTDWGCRIFHFDEMDGGFVPAMVGGPGIVKALADKAFVDVHLMITSPSRHVAAYVKAGADMITVHAEAPDADEALMLIRKTADQAGRPVLAGLALMPGTSLDEIGSLLALEPDMILVLSLDPRTGSPADIPAACARLNALRNLTAESQPLLAFDGGVTMATIQEISTCAPDMIVSGSAIFRADDPEDTFKKMQEALLSRGV